MSPREKLKALGTSTPVTLGLMVTMLGAAATAGGALRKADEQERRIEKLEAQSEKVIEVVHGLDKKQEVTAAELARLVAAIQSLESAVREPPARRPR
jgi:hypothetical protein